MKLPSLRGAVEGGLNNEGEMVWGWGVGRGVLSTLFTTGFGFNQSQVPLSTVA